MISNKLELLLLNKIYIVDLKSNWGVVIGLYQLIKL